MPEDTNQALTLAALKLLRPLVRLLMRHGMAYGTFAEIARKAYVDEGFTEISQSGKRPTVSSISALTGLTRKETKRLREINLIGGEASSQRYSRAIRVVSGWLNDSRFQTADGGPAILPFESGEASFSSLVKEYSGDIPPAAMLSVLESSNTLKSGESGVELLSRAYIPHDTPVDKINILGTDIAELAATIGHNIEFDPQNRWFQRKVSNIAVNKDALPAFRKLSNQKSQELLEEYHAWLSAAEIDVNQAGEEEPRYVAVGIYYHEHEITEEDRQ
ncbi:MAG: hypothetical protein IMF06_08335 [Proteobacteria bacterium]|nr:hypothetical protein [Pseudomonadota bacterium]